jgi:AcrR family transcriptional regulator
VARPRSNIQARILRAARKRFLAEGVDGAALRRIAADARTSIGMVYYYFHTKDDLFLAVVEEIYQAFVADLARLLGSDAPFDQRLQRVSTRFAAMSAHELDVIRLILREVLASSSRLDKIMARFERGHLAVLIDAVARALREGDIDGRHHPMALMLCIFGLCAAPQVMRRLAARLAPMASAPEGAELAAILVDVLFHGIAPRQPGRKAQAGRAR